MSTQKDWSEYAEAVPDVFAPPKIAPQGQDGVPHFNYYDPERELSFQWDGRYEQHITVSHGGYGEPVKWTFDYADFVSAKVAPMILERRGPLPELRSMWDAAYWFGLACQNWIEDQENAA